MPNTKIVATLGPATDAPDMLRQLFAAGVDVFRLNASHGSQDEHAARIDSVRAQAREARVHVGILLDLQGPKTLLFFANPFFYMPKLGFFLQMLPYALVIVILFIGSREAMKKRIGAPAALGLPYVRGERGL